MIVGLANPYLRYHRTRHNIGSWYVYALAKYYKQEFFEEKKFLGYTSIIYIDNQMIRLLIPNIFMNINGKSVFLMSSFYNISLEQMLIVHDDLDLSPGIIKKKFGYGNGGHKGLKNIISYFSGKINFYRFRIGIGRPDQLCQISNYVLSQPSEYDCGIINTSINNMINSRKMFFKKG
ncbi:MAG: aminoacyl-tRNA hydrolase [Buchnera aphidicola (Eriosoma harunire)]